MEKEGCFSSSQKATGPEAREEVQNNIGCHLGNVIGGGQKLADPPVFPAPGHAENGEILQMRRKKTPLWKLLQAKSAETARTAAYE